MDFKFQWLDDNGNQTGFLSKKGHFDGEMLVLDDVTVPAAVLTQVETRGNRMIVGTIDEDGEPMVCAFAVTKGNAGDLRRELGIARSAVWAKSHREDLEKEGRAGEFRAEKCPNCGAVIDLTGMPESPQVHCQFCDCIGTLDDQGFADQGAVRKHWEADYRLCDECGMYSKPRRFTILYLYFLIVVFGYNYRITWRCPGCMRGEAWKMLFGNLIFVFGVPVALVQLFRAYGGADVGAALPGLDKANLKARKGDLEGAIASYQSILEKVPTQAGVKYNIGLAILAQNDVQRAAKMFEYALNDCANYAPAARMLGGCYEQLGETEKLAELKRQWNAGKDPGEKEEASVEDLPLMEVDDAELGEEPA
jgi:hypothetical protein